jgi:hypothetical protein
MSPLDFLPGTVQQPLTDEPIPYTLADPGTLTDVERRSYIRLRHATRGLAAGHLADVGVLLTAIDRLTGSPE